MVLVCTSQTMDFLTFCLKRGTDVFYIRTEIRNKTESEWHHGGKACFAHCELGSIWPSLKSSLVHLLSGFDLWCLLPSIYYESF